MNRFLLYLLCSFSFFSLSIASPAKDGNTVDSLKSATLSGLSFRCIGPAYCSGRIADFAVNPDNPAEYFVSVAAGHVWKTTNAGTTYTPVFDGYGSYSCGPIVIDPSNHNVVWLGSGEYNSQRSVGYGDGIYKSEDGGSSWKNMGLKNSEHIGRIAIDPRNSEVVYVAVQGPLWGPGGDRGIYKTTDGGKNWKAVLTVSENTGFNDILIDPRNPDVLYASAYQRRRHVWTLVDGGPECAVYKSTDAGATWNKINKGLPEGAMGRIGLAISPSNPDILYAIVEAKEDKGGFFRSTNRGASWEKRNSLSTVSAQYYNRLFVDQKNADRIISVDTWTQISEDGGKTWRAIGNKHRHVDDHACWIDPNNPKHLLIGGDGGIYETWDMDNWNFKPNLPVTQFYRVSVDNDLPFYNVYGGTQDNASMYGPSRNTSAQGIVNDDWVVTHGGDGFETQVDPVDPNILYAQSQYGYLARYDKKSGEELPIQPQPPVGEAYRWNWDSPLIISPHKGNRLYFAANKLFKSDDRGNTWTVISPDLSRQLDRNQLPVMGKIQSIDAVAKNASTSFYGNIVSLTESPLQENLIYVGTDDGLVQVTEDGGANWRKIDKFQGIPENTYVSCLLASQSDASTVYASFDNHKNSDFKPYILKSTDKGKTWKNIASNLPVRGSVNTIAEDHINGKLLFVGTEFGLYTSLNSGNTWIQLKNGLPTIAIKDIAIQKRENDLVLATFGRGYYILDDYSPLRQLTDEALTKEIHLFSVKDALMFIPRGERYGQGESYYSAKNPEVGATFTYYLKEDLKTKKSERQKAESEAEKKNLAVAIPSRDVLRSEDNEEEPYLLFTIYDQAGQVVRKLKGSGSEGLQRIIWDFRFPSPWPVSGSGQAFDNRRSGAYAMPGKYKLKVAKVTDGVLTDFNEEISFNTVGLNNSTLGQADRKALEDFQLKVSDMTRVSNGASRQVGFLLDRIKTIREVISGTTNLPVALQTKARDIQFNLMKLSVALDGDPSLSKRNENQPPSITDRINETTWGIYGSTSSPTKTMTDSYEIAMKELKPVLESLKKLQEIDLKEIENALEKAGAPWTPGRIPELKY
jgi:photosystem II stability/assembly factor-like uncharacterized protein